MTTTLIGATDGDLARAIAARAGTADAAETELYRRFAPRVRLYGLRHLRDEDAARDLMQQVLLLTIEKLREGAVRDMDMIGSFILGTSRMLAANLKRRDRRREALLDAFPTDTRPSAPRQPSSTSRSSKAACPRWPSASARSCCSPSTAIDRRGRSRRRSGPAKGTSA